MRVHLEDMRQQLTAMERAADSARITAHTSVRVCFLHWCPAHALVCVCVSNGASVCVNKVDISGCLQLVSMLLI